METNTPQNSSRPQPYGSTNLAEQPITSCYELQDDQRNQTTAAAERFEDEIGDEDDDEDESNEMSLEELLYSSSSYHAIAKPGKYGCV